MSDGRFRPGSEHPNAIDLEERLRLLQGLDTGTLTLTHIRRAHRSRMEVRTRCRECRKFRWLDATNIMRGLTSNCRCQRRVKYRTKGEHQLGERYDAAIHRCNCPSNPSYANYGGRGIRMLFPSRHAYVRYIYDRWPLESYSGLDIDRIDTNGPYAPGNIRLATRRQNVLNRRNTKFILFNGETIPCADLWFRLREANPRFGLSRGTTTKLANSGASIEDILSRKPRPRKRPVRNRVRPGPRA